MRLRLIAPVLLVLAVTAGGFLAVRILSERDAREDAEHRAEIAATEVRGGVEQASNLVESLRRFLLGGRGAGVTNAEFADIGARWLSPVGLPAATWVERVPGPGGRSALRATLVTGADPMTASGLKLSGEAGVAAAVADPRTLFRVTATPLARVPDGRTGLFLVQAAPRLSGGVLEPGFAVLFVPGSWLLAEVTEERNPTLQLRAGNTSYGGIGNADGIGSSFFAAGRRFEVIVPQEPVRGAAALLPWLVLGAGLVLAALAGSLALTADRRSRAQQEADRIFTLSPDPVVVVGPDGHFSRVNPALQSLLGYSAEELLARPVMDFIHPDDRARSLAAGAALLPGGATGGFENRYVCKDGSVRWLEWTVTRASEQAVYAAARDVTERRRTETEQAALRRIATLATVRGRVSHELFAVVAEEVARVVAVPLVRVMRYEADNTATSCASFATKGQDIPFGSRSSLEGMSVLRLVRETVRAARIDDYSELEGEIAEIARRSGIRSAVGSPIVVAGRLWGAIIASSEEPLPEGTDQRLADFTDLLASAIGNAESRDALERLADEQAALRRVATRVAEGLTGPELFDEVAREVARLFGIPSVTIDRYDPDGYSTVVASVDDPGFPVGSRWPLDGPSLGLRVFETARPARIDDYSGFESTSAAVMRQTSKNSAVGVPIIVDGGVWGIICVGTTSGTPLPQGIERRIADFTELVATAIANAEAREARERLAEEQAARRRVATLVARGDPPMDVFAAVAEEVGRLLAASRAYVTRYEASNAAMLVAGWSAAGDDVPVGLRFEVGEGGAAALVRRTASPARVDAYAPGSAAVTAEIMGVQASVAAPINVEGRLWGLVLVGAATPLPAGTEERLAGFTELAATAIANTHARAQVTALAEEQAALRRVATLVAQGVRPAEMFAAVTEEVSRIVEVPAVSVVRYEADGTATELANYFTGGKLFPAGVRMNIEGTNILRLVRDSGAAARIDDYTQTEGEMAEIVRNAGIQSTVGIPIVVAGRIWGTMVGSTTEPGPLLEDTGSRLARFTELLATAIENAESREALQQLADEQAALRRVATLVAEGVQPTEIFSAVTDEIGRLFGSDTAMVARYEPDGAALVSVGVGKSLEGISIGARWELDEGMAVTRVFRTGHSARLDATELDSVGGPIADIRRRLGVVSVVVSPIVVEGRLWGAVSVSARESLPLDAEERLEKFNELLATAIANAEGKSELAASRRRIVAASDDARRRIERDLHDGTQQRLASLRMAVGSAEVDVPPELTDLRAELSRVATGLADAVTELQEISRGIHPAILSQGGLGPALRNLARRSVAPVELEVTTDARLQEPIEVAAYYVASEALANATKHAQASRIDVSLAERNGSLVLSIRDDGVGGADSGQGSGLVGLRDRVEALGGTIMVKSPPGGGTSLAVTLPLDVELATSGAGSTAERG